MNATNATKLNATNATKLTTNATVTFRYRMYQMATTATVMYCYHTNSPLTARLYNAMHCLCLVVCDHRAFIISLYDEQSARTLDVLVRVGCGWVEVSVHGEHAHQLTTNATVTKRYHTS